MRVGSRKSKVENKLLRVESRQRVERQKTIGIRERKRVRLTEEEEEVEKIRKSTRRMTGEENEDQWKERQMEGDKFNIGARGERVRIRADEDEG